MAEARAHELAGRDPVAEAVDTISMPRLVCVAADVDGAALRRAIVVLSLMNDLHVALAAQQHHARQRRAAQATADRTNVPPPPRDRSPLTQRLYRHPLWKTLSRGNWPMAPHTTAKTAALAVVLAEDPHRLDEMESYLDLLCDVTGLPVTKSRVPASADRSSP